MKEPVPTGHMRKGVGLFVLIAEFPQRLTLKDLLHRKKLNIA